MGLTIRINPLPSLPLFKVRIILPAFFMLLFAIPAHATAIAESTLNMYWDTLTITRSSGEEAVEGVDYDWNYSSIYYGAHSESQRNNSADVDQESNSINPLSSSGPDSVLTTSGWAPETNGSSFLTKSSSETGGELASVNAYAYSDNADNSFSNGNAHRGRTIYIYTDDPLIFSINYAVEHYCSIDALSLEDASVFSRPNIFFRDNYKTAGDTTVASKFAEISNGLNSNDYNLSYSDTGTLSLTEDLLLGNSGITGYENTGIYWFEGHAHTSASVRSEYQSETPVPEPATMFLLGTGLIGLAGFRRKFKKS